jgi:hypothetical protein
MSVWKYVIRSTVGCKNIEQWQRNEEHATTHKEKLERAVRKHENEGEINSDDQ